MTESTNFRVFYSWQSDLPDSSNRALIRHSLRDAATILEQRSNGLVVVEIDEATRGMAGSPNIPATILAKIVGSDMVVCDITPISESQAGKGLPNPNVVFELGYAVANLGWQRVVLLFNKEFGAFPGQVPFDFDRHDRVPRRGVRVVSPGSVGLVLS